MKDNRSKFSTYIAAIKRLYMWNYKAKDLDLILVTEYPKSGGSWLCQMISDATSVPFPRNINPSLERGVMHGHHLFHPRMNKAVHVLRDGRDVMVSAYFHFLFDNSHNQTRGVAQHRKKLRLENYEDVISNMPSFIKYMFEDYSKQNRHFSWSEIIRNTNQYENKICSIKYEELLEDPIKCLKRVLYFYNFSSNDNLLSDVVEKYSFKKLANRNPGEENRASFVRKGISGDWKNYFNETSCEVFKNYAGEELIMAGYEENNNWSSFLNK